jgi:hypothetical protein
MPFLGFSHIPGLRLKKPKTNSGVAVETAAATFFDSSEAGTALIRASTLRL